VLGAPSAITGYYDAKHADTGDVLVTRIIFVRDLVSFQSSLLMTKLQIRPVTVMQDIWSTRNNNSMMLKCDSLIELRVTETDKLLAKLILVTNLHVKSQ